jgi:branched-chain amino acid transport system ATP-binding protein
MAMLAIDGLTVDYGRIRAVRDVSFTLAEREIVTLVGPNGAGKTSILNAIAGVVPPRAGTVALEGKAIAGTRPERIARLGLALVPESRRIFTRLTVGENLRLAAAALPRGLRRERVRQQTERFEVLGRCLHRPAGTLSGGEQQQLAIARALVCDPRVVLFDEPSLGLAPLVVDAVFELIGALRDEGRSIVLVEQSVARAVALADRAYLLDGGSIASEASSEEPGALEAFEASYLGM